jgi:5'-nucleotidase
MKRILVTNDDGVHSEGIHALAAALERLGDVIVVAPHLEASAIGHALTLRRPLRMEQLRERVYEVDGTPSDCVNIAFSQIFHGLPDLVVSGINKGYNLGDDVTYSGTVAGALGGAAGNSTSRSRSSGSEPTISRLPRAASEVAAGAEQQVGTFSMNVPSGQPKGTRDVQAAQPHHCGCRA